MSERRIPESPLYVRSEVEAIAEDLLAETLLSFERASAHLAEPNRIPMPGAPSTMENIALRYLRSRPDAVRNRAIASYKARSPEARARLFGHLAQADLALDKPLRQQAERLERRRRFTLPTPPPAGVMALSLGGGEAYSRLRLRLHRVHSVEETDGWGSDEILMSGASTDANGTVRKLSQFKVSDDFDAGETVKYSPPKSFANFDFNNSNSLTIDGVTYPVGWPRQFNVTVVLAEEDSGGFPDYLQELLEELRKLAEKEVAKAVTQAAAGAIGTALGAAIGAAVGAGIGAAAGAIVGWIVGELIAFLIEAWEDDLFPPVTKSVVLNSPVELFGGAENSVNKTSTFRGHGGEYDVVFDWELSGSMPYRPLTLEVPSPGAVRWPEPGQAPAALPRATAFSRGGSSRTSRAAFIAPASRALARTSAATAIASAGTSAGRASIRRPHALKMRTDIFMRGMDRGIYQTWQQDGAAWNAWGKNTGAGTFRSGVTATSFGQDRLDLFARGDDDRVWQAFWTPGGWSGWNALGSQASISGPAAVSRATNRLDVFTVGPDRRMRRIAWDGAHWSAWKDDLGAATFISEPTVCSWNSTRLDVFALGDDRSVYHAWSFNGGVSWGGWTSEVGAGTFASAPAAISTRPGIIDLFAVGDDRRMYHNTFNGTAWSGWMADLGPGTFLSGPSAIAPASDRLEVFAVGDDQRMWRAEWNPSVGWQGWFDDLGAATFMV